MKLESVRKEKYIQNQKSYKLENFKTRCKLRRKHIDLVTTDILNFMLDFTEVPFLFRNASTKI